MYVFSLFLLYKVHCVCLRRKIMVGSHRVHRLLYVVNYMCALCKLLSVGSAVCTVLLWRCCSSAGTRKNLSVAESVVSYQLLVCRSSSSSVYVKYVQQAVMMMKSFFSRQAAGRGVCCRHWRAMSVFVRSEQTSLPLFFTLSVSPGVRVTLSFFRS